MTDSEDTPLWLFSLKFYSYQGFRESLLAFQDFSGANVNIVLYLLWLASHRRAISLNEVEKIISSTKSWNEEIVQPLRRIRQNLKKNVDGLFSEDILSLREKVKTLELGAEKIEQRTLFNAYEIQFLGSLGTEIEAIARANLETYEQLLDASFPKQHFECLIDSVSNGFH